MKCPTCDEGTIKKILFTRTAETAYLCDFCGSVWFAKEDIHDSTGHMIQSLTKNEGMEYTFEDDEEVDGESGSIMYPKFK